MGRNRPPHIQDVSVPDVPLSILAAVSGGGLASIAEVAAGRVDVFVQFSDGRRYRYPDVPTTIALALYANPSEDNFQQIRYWPGYQRVS